MQDIDHDRLHDVAAGQARYFSTGQAIEADVARSTPHHHASPGDRYERVGRALVDGVNDRTPIGNKPPPTGYASPQVNDPAQRPPTGPSAFDSRHFD